MTEEQSKLVIRLLTSPLIQSLAVDKHEDSEIETSVKRKFRCDLNELEVVSGS